MPERLALHVAMDIFHRPAAVRDYLKAPLPQDVLTVIRIAAGGDIEPDKFGPDQKRRASDIREASVFFVQQILFHPQADAYRLLGLRPGADFKQVQDHKRMLLKWLHPDRNPNKWEQVLFQRVVNAAAEIEAQPSEAIIALSGNGAQSRRKRTAPARSHYSASLQRVPLKGRWRTRIMKHVKRALFVLSVAMIMFVSAQMFTGGNPWDLNVWREMIEFKWLKFYL